MQNSQNTSVKFEVKEYGKDVEKERNSLSENIILL